MELEHSIFYCTLLFSANINWAKYSICKHIKDLVILYTKILCNIPYSLSIYLTPSTHTPPHCVCQTSLPALLILCRQITVLLVGKSFLSAHRAHSRFGLKLGARNPTKIQNKAMLIILAFALVFVAIVGAIGCQFGDSCNKCDKGDD